MKDNDIHSHEKVEKLLNSDSVTKPTRKALRERIVKGKAVVTNRFLKPYPFYLLSIIGDRLMDQDAEDRIVNIAIFIDERLHNHTCDGWRYDDMPPDDQMLLKGLDGIDEASIAMFGKIFIALKKEDQIKVLKSIQHGTAPGSTWSTLSAKRFFEELLAEATEIFFSHPLVQLQIHYEGLADARGWEQIGLNEIDNVEAT